MAVARQLLTSNSVEWYTPPDLLAEVAAFLGPGWHDPCPARQPGQPLQNGLWQSWAGLRLFINPPYGRAGNIPAWIRKAMTEPVDEVVLLVKAATDTAWFQPLWDHTLVFIRGRLHFQGSRDAGATFPSVLVYRGPRADAFAAAFAHRGAVMVRHTSDDRGGDAA